MAQKSPSISNIDPTVQRSIERTLAQENAMVSRSGKAVLSNIADMIRSAERNFTPVVGTVYHLYKSSTGYVLSPIKFDASDKRQYIGSYRLAIADVWEKV